MWVSSNSKKRTFHRRRRKGDKRINGKEKVNKAIVIVNHYSWKSDAADWQFDCAVTAVTWVEGPG